MRLRKLARLCELDQLKEHFILPTIWAKDQTAENFCPGGEFLAEDTLVVEIESIPDGGGSDHIGKYYPRWACDALEKLLRERGCYPSLGPSRPGFVGSEDILDALLAARPGQ